MSDDTPRTFTTDKIGLAAYLCLKNIKLLDVKAKNRNRSIFEFEINEDEANQMELDFTRSDFARYFDAFKYLRDRTIKRDRNTKGYGSGSE